MHSSHDTSTWEFADALKLLHRSKPVSTTHGLSQVTTRTKRSTSGLGDFSCMWRELGIVAGTQPTNLSGSSEPLQVKESAISGTDRTIPDPSLPLAPPPRDEAYVSDGGYPAGRKTVTWRKEPDIAETTDAPTTPTSEEDTLHSALEASGNVSNGDGNSSLQRTKKEAKKAKKLRRKLRKDLHLQEQEQKIARRKVVSDVESESDIRQAVKPSPAAIASKHLKPRTDTELQITTQRDNPSILPVQSLQIEARDFEPAHDAAPSQHPKQAVVQQHAHMQTPSQSSAPPRTPSKPAQKQFSLHAGNLVPTAVAQPIGQNSGPSIFQPQSVTAISPPRTNFSSFQTPGTTKSQQVTHFIASATQLHRQEPQFSNSAATTNQSTNVGTAMEAVQQSRNKSSQRYKPPWSGKRQRDAFLRSAHSLAAQSPLAHHSPSDQSTIMPRETLTSNSRLNFQILEKEDRDLQLFLRLVNQFPDDKKYLSRPVPMADHNASPTGIHVFVDFSNIWIGFMDHLKDLQFRLRQQIPHRNLSFDALVLLLERRRPVAKRVLAGSYPLLPAMELAQQIGYETAILEKVYKAREPTERQRRQLALQSRNAFAALGTQGTSSATPAAAVSTPATTPSAQPQTSITPSPAPEKWVEQAVDEILHLKILESIVDTDEPSRMVVATGDAAKAEYSEGFMKMILRALKKGWTVELVAFSKSISSEYRRYDFLNQWGERFRIIALDDWAQFLLDT